MFTFVLQMLHHNACTAAQEMLHNHFFWVQSRWTCVLLQYTLLCSLVFASVVFMCINQVHKPAQLIVKFSIFYSRIYNVKMHLNYFYFITCRKPGSLTNADLPISEFSWTASAIPGIVIMWAGISLSAKSRWLFAWFSFVTWQDIVGI